MQSIGKTIAQICVAALVLLLLNGCIAYPVIGYREYTPEFTGKVTTRDGKPVSGMKVSMNCYDRRWEGQTDANGVFRVSKQGHWYFFVTECMIWRKIYPKQEYFPGLYDFVFYFEKGNEKDFLIGMLHDYPFDELDQIPTFSNFVGMDLCTVMYVDGKIQKEEARAKKYLDVRDFYFHSYLKHSDRTYYYRRTIFFLKKNRKDFKVVTDDYILTLDEVFLNYFSEFISWDRNETRSAQNQ